MIVCWGQDIASGKHTAALRAPHPTQREPDVTGTHSFDGGTDPSAAAPAPAAAGDAIDIGAIGAVLDPNRSSTGYYQVDSSSQ